MSKAIRDQAMAHFADAVVVLQKEAAEACKATTGFYVPHTSWKARDLSEASAEIPDVGTVRYTRSHGGNHLWLGGNIFTDLASLGALIAMYDRYANQK